MARTAKTVTIEEDGEETEGPLAGPAPEREIAAKLKASLFDFQGDARVRLLHRNEKTQRFEPHGYFPADATEEHVLNEFGGGRFRAMLLVRNPLGQEVIETQRDFDLPGYYKPPTGDLPGIGSRDPTALPKRESVAVAASGMSMLPGSGDLMEILKAGIIEKLLDIMKTSREVHAPAGPDPMLMKLMETQAATQQKMMEFMLTLATKDKSGSKEDMFETMTKVKELIGPPPSVSGDPMAMFNTMLETFTRMREVADDINPSTQRGSGDSLMDSIPRLVEVVAEQHELNKQQRAAATQRGPQRMPSVAVPSSLPSQPEPSLAIWQMLLRRQAARLLSSAAAKHDPDVIAGTAILFAPPNVKEALALFLHRDAAAVMADVLVEIPGLADHRDWVADFITAAQERMFPDEFTDEIDEAVEGKPDGDTA